MVSILRLEEVDSTNTYVAKNVAELESATIVTTDNQTAGRGQRGNSWESEPGMNLTFTMLMRPEKFAAIRQFSLSEAVAVAIVDVIGEELEIFTEIKWPNDIYWRDNKLAGILIEHAVMGSEIMHTIIGVGLNVNQTKFLSDAPNPISLRQILINRGEKGDTIIDRDILLEKIGTRIKENILRLTDKKELERMHDKYMRRLWRNNNQVYKFRDVESGRIYPGIVGEIEPTGHLCIYEPKAGNIAKKGVANDDTGSNVATSNKMTDDDCICHRYAFKEVEWII